VISGSTYLVIESILPNDFPVIYFGLTNQPPGLLDVKRHCLHEFCCLHPIRDAMIGGESHLHPFARDDHAVFHHRQFLDRTDCQDDGFGRTDCGGEILPTYTPHF